MITRKITDEFKTLLTEYPVVTLIGPRQSGKTTLSRSLKGYDYANLEEPESRDFAKEDPKGFLNQFKDKKVIFDEIQRVPELLSYIQVEVDKNRKAGRFILTGSHQLRLTEAISQSLAGRTAVLRLLPLSFEELKLHGEELDSFQEVALKGFYPTLYHKAIRSQTFYSNYYLTYVERDVRQLIHLKDVELFERFVRLLAGRVAQLMNLSGLAKDVGVDTKTIKKWLSVLEASFVIMKLPPYYHSTTKRLVKSPKYFFTDTGLLCFLLGIQNVNQLSRDPLQGSVFENLVVMEIYKTILNRGEHPQLFFYRDKIGYEIDLVIQTSGKWEAVEIKSSQTFKMEQTKNLLKFPDYVQDEISSLNLIYAGEAKTLSSGIKAVNFKDSSTLI